MIHSAHLRAKRALDQNAAFLALLTMKLLIKLGMASLVIFAAAASATVCLAQERVDGVRIEKRGLFIKEVVTDEINIVNGKEFKGAKRIAISAFNVAFPAENHYTAITERHSLLARTSSSAKAYMDTVMTGVDQATQQRIADKAYTVFVQQLTAAGYDVVEPAELAQLTPEYATWEALPNFTQGRFGTYVAPTGRALFFLQGDSAKRDTSGQFGAQAISFRALDKPQAHSRSPYLAYDGKLGILAVTIVVDYGVYSSSGLAGTKGAGATAEYKPGVTIAAGNDLESATVVKSWGPNSGGFPGGAFLLKPVRSESAFVTITGMEARKEKAEDVAVRDIKVTADPAKFAEVADEVLLIALPKLVNAMVAER